MSRLLVGPFNRTEGDLEVALEIADGRVTEARVNAPLYRGFERMLLGKHPHDALVIRPDPGKGPAVDQQGCINVGHRGVGTAGECATCCWPASLCSTT